MSKNARGCLHINCSKAMETAFPCFSIEMALKNENTALKRHMMGSLSFVPSPFSVQPSPNFSSDCSKYSIGGPPSNSDDVRMTMRIAAAAARGIVPVPVSFARRR